MRQVKVVEWSNEEEIPVIARRKDYFDSKFPRDIWEIILSPEVVKTNLDDLLVWTIVFLHSLNDWLMLAQYGVHIKKFNPEPRKRRQFLFPEEIS